MSALPGGTMTETPLSSWLQKPEPKRNFVQRNGDPIWTGPDTLEYADFSAKLESDKGAYATIFLMIRTLLEEKARNDPSFKAEDAVILDFGCHTGSGTRLLQPLGSDIRGVDSNPIVIQDAQKNPYNGENVHYSVVGRNEEIDLPRQADIAVLTFVHPTIADRNELYFTLEKIYRALKPGGIIILLGLNPDSFDPSFHFTSYEHNKFGTKYEDGKPFDNKLILSEDRFFQFKDTAWTDTTLTFGLTRARFGSVNIFPLTATLEGPAGDILRQVLVDLSETNPALAAGDEWKDPGLFKMYTGFKQDISTAEDILQQIVQES